MIIIVELYIGFARKNDKLNMKISSKSMVIDLSREP